jgi:hypothetical protein
MSYCVNCGVELEAAQKTCPLCKVAVVNPNEPREEEKTTFPIHRDELKKTDRMFWIKFITILLVVPIITCVLTNLLSDQRITWSIYVIAGVFILWVLATVPFYFKKFNYIKMLLLDIAGIIIGLFVIEIYAAGAGWVMLIVLPIGLYCMLAGLIIVYLAKARYIRRLGVAAAIFISIAVMLPGLEVLIDIYNSNPVNIAWSWFVIAPCLSVAALLILLNKNKRFKNELQKRLHF